MNLDATGRVLPPTEADIARARELEKLIDGKIFSISSNEPRGLQIAVVIPYGTNRGLLTLFLAVRQFIRSARPALNA